MGGEGAKRAEKAHNDSSKAGDSGSFAMKLGVNGMSGFRGPRLQGFCRGGEEGWDLAFRANY